MIFPLEVIEAGKRPQWLVSMTDDSWFGPWAGPFQHLAIAKVRAAEEGLAIARAANTGVSAIIDPYGRIIAMLGLNKAGILDGPLPQPLEPTMYSLAGDAIFAALMLLAAAIGIVFCRFSLQDG
jgi:apolipoprotein N-acyltransferase